MKDKIIELDTNILSDYLKVKVLAPTKGNKKKLIDMCNNNAKILLNEKFELIKKDEAKTTLANEELKNILNLDKLDRIELFDNSHLFGTFYVGGMVVFDNFLSNKNEYRKFKIDIKNKDDLSAMKEVIYRRYYRVLLENLKIYT